MGTIQGIITAARIGLLNRMCLFKTSASPRPEHRLEGDGHQGIDERILGGLVKDGVGQEIDEIPEADELPEVSPIMLSVRESQMPRKKG